ncbi:type VI secretion system protein TssA [Pseudomonas sp. OIL-1]|uniref:type VI secretion system protein TssA n=1 Tax=Pseudomonas sp. OIL-1 TaxID=2706126 RepID=UPI0013A7653A|nr:type VI secretion system protein TssA [Pseudomonas sp. OIL-1]
MASMPVQHYLENVAHKPISDADFAGTDVRYSPEFEALEAELAKTGSLHQGEGTDWETVRVTAEAILTTSSKDLRVAAWLAWSLFQEQSLSGLQAGIAVIHALCTGHWSELHPRKMRTRSAALRWLQPRLEQALGECSPQPDDFDALRAIAPLLRGLDTQLSAQLGSDTPELLPLCRRLEELVKRSEQEHTPPPLASTPIKPVVVSSSSSDSDTPQSSKDAHKLLRQLQDQGRQLCSWWQQQKVGDVRSIKLSRTLLWLPIDNAPEHDANNVTALRGLPADRLAAYQERLAQGHYSELLLDLETSIARAPFWLDGQYLAWQCLQNLNNEAAMQELESQLGAFLKRLPDLHTLCFHDGAPFASGEALNWITTRVLAQDLTHQPDANSAAAASDTTAAWNNALQDALVVLRDDGLKAAVQHIKQASQQAKGGRDRFHWKLAQARLCYHAGKYEMASVQLDSLDQLLQTSGLGDWEPDLNLQVLSLSYRCCERLPQQHMRERKEEIYRRLCHLDLEVVLDQAFGP